MQNHRLYSEAMVWCDHRQGISWSLAYWPECWWWPSTFCRWYAVAQLTGVVTTVFGKVKDVSRNNRSSLKAKLQLYESIILWNLLICSAKLWPLTSLVKKAGWCLSQLAKKNTRCLLERQGNKWRSQGKNWTTKDRDCTGLVIWYGWTTSAYHSKHYTGRFQDSEEDHVAHGQTGKTFKDCSSPGKRQRQQPSTYSSGIGEWPSAFIHTYN